MESISNGFLNSIHFKNPCPSHFIQTPARGPWLELGIEVQKCKL